jgi:myo-inositol 2-dehydrogenase/D-chiro-inositol 1-dehydrogenase
VAGPYLPFFLERYAAAYAAELDHFISSIEAGTAPSPSVLDGRAALVIAEAAGQSLSTKGHVQVA